MNHQSKEPLWLQFLYNTMNYLIMYGRALLLNQGSFQSYLSRVKNSSFFPHTFQGEATYKWLQLYRKTNPCNMFLTFPG